MYIISYNYYILQVFFLAIESDVDSITTTNARHQSTYGFTTTSSRQESTDESTTTNASRQSTDEIYLTTDPPTDLQSVIYNHDSNIIAPAIGGAVGGLIVVIAVIAVVLIALLFIKRGQKGSLKVNNGKESVQGYNNAVYDGKQNTQTDK